MTSSFGAPAQAPHASSRARQASFACALLTLFIGCGGDDTADDGAAGGGPLVAASQSSSGAAGSPDSGTGARTSPAGPSMGGAGAAETSPSGGGGASNVSGGASPSNGGESASGAGPSANGGAGGRASGGGTGGTGTSGGGTNGGGAAGASGPPKSACPDLPQGPVSSSAQHLDIGVHDPAMIWSGTRYYLFGTSNLLSIRSSPNMQQWAGSGSVFNAMPAWIGAALGNAPGGLWAPDVAYFDCKYHVYYAGSSFGSNNSVIGLATTPTLDSASPNYRWTDQGEVVRSMTSNNYNAIDPNVAFDEAGTPWLSFGSFWSGIKLRMLDYGTGKPSSVDTTLYAIAGRNGGAIEAPSIVSHHGFYYLFVSYDNCCKGVNSTYRTMVGRASKITGPYSNKAGQSMMQGAAEEVLKTAGRYVGPGGGTAFRTGTRYLYAFHYYDGNGNGASKLQVRPIDFDADDWPTVGEPLFP